MEWWSYYIFVQEAQEPKKRMLEILILYLIHFATPVLLQWNQHFMVSHFRMEKKESMKLLTGWSILTFSDLILQTAHICSWCNLDCNQSVPRA